MEERRYDWGPWLQEYNALLIEKLDPGDIQYLDADELSAVQSGWLGSDPASEVQVQALEQRLTKRLPPSYRQFLLASNGLLQPVLLVPRLFTADEVEWYRVRNQETIDIWAEYARPGAATEDDPDFFVQFLPGMLEISATEKAGTARYLLCPERVNEDGEWEAYYYAHWLPGAERFASFWELMQRERDYTEKHLPPPEAG